MFQQRDFVLQGASGPFVWDHRTSAGALAAILAAWTAPLRAAPPRGPRLQHGLGPHAAGALATYRVEPKPSEAGLIGAGQGASTAERPAAEPGGFGPRKRVPASDIVHVGRRRRLGGADGTAGGPVRSPRLTPLARTLMLMLAGSIFGLGLQKTVRVGTFFRGTVITVPENPHSMIG